MVSAILDFPIPEKVRTNGRRHDAIDLTGYDHLRRHQAALLAGNMVLDGVPLATIRFIIKVYPLFLQQRHVNCTQMARLYNCSPQAAGKHVAVLTEMNYLDRIHYRAWSVNDEYLMSLAPV